MNYGDGDAPLKDKANFIMSMLELVVGGSGLTAEKSVIERCLPRFMKSILKIQSLVICRFFKTYTICSKIRKKKSEKAGNGNGDLCNRLLIFNHQSNVDLNKQLCFDIKELEVSLKIGMLVIQIRCGKSIAKQRK